MQDHYTLRIDSNNDDDVPIATMGNKIIYLHKTSKANKRQLVVKSDKYDILPLPFGLLRI